MSIRCTSTHDGQVERIVLATPKANVLDGTMVGAITEHLRTLARPELKLVVFEGEGRHFSFGASVEEHLPAQVNDMITGFHQLFRELEALNIPTAAVVRGQCLGGGFELATWAGRVFADPTARLGIPEVKLAVFPPIAALALRWRMGGNAATELILTGASITGEQALAKGVVDVCCDDPEAELQAWISENILPRSAVALRFAWRASRAPVARSIADELPALESLYLSDLMSHRDPVEGITAFVERRNPSWSHS